MTVSELVKKLHENCPLGFWGAEELTVGVVQLPRWRVYYSLVINSQKLRIQSTWDPEELMQMDDTGVETITHWTLLEVLGGIKNWRPKKAGRKSP